MVIRCHSVAIDGINPEYYGTGYKRITTDDN